MKIKNYIFYVTHMNNPQKIFEHEFMQPLLKKPVGKVDNKFSVSNC